MKLFTLIMNKVRRPNKQGERLERLARNAAKVDDLHDRAARIMRENGLAPAIKRALEGR